MEEVKNLLKTLSAEQIEEIKRKESNDKVAFLQSGKCDDRVRLVCEEKDNTGQSLLLNRTPQSNSDSEGWSCIESESDSSTDDEENRAIHPLTDSEESEIDEESEDSDKDKESIANGKSLNTESLHRSNKTKGSYKRRKSKP